MPMSPKTCRDLRLAKDAVRLWSSRGRSGRNARLRASHVQAPFRRLRSQAPRRSGERQAAEGSDSQANCVLTPTRSAVVPKSDNRIAEETQAMNTQSQTESLSPTESLSAMTGPLPQRGSQPEFNLNPPPSARTPMSVKKRSGAHEPIDV